MTVCNVIIFKSLVTTVSAPRLKAATTQMLCVANQPCDLPAQEDRTKITTSHENQQRGKQHRLPDRNETNATVRLFSVFPEAALTSLPEAQQEQDDKRTQHCIRQL